MTAFGVIMFCQLDLTGRIKLKKKYMVLIIILSYYKVFQQFCHPVAMHLPNNSILMDIAGIYYI